MDTKQKDIFRRLKGYSHGFYAYATEEEKQAYNAKVKELQAKIIADVNRAPEIIAEAFATYYAEMYRKQMQGKYAEMKCDAEWKAIDNVLGALISVKVLKGIKVGE